MFDWRTILEIVFVIGTIVALIILYRRNYLDEEYLANLDAYLDAIDDGTGLVSVLSNYARLAVQAVEQMVRAGVIPKEDKARKEKAIEIVNELAKTDSIELEECADETIGNLIEFAVDDMRVDF